MRGPIDVTRELLAADVAHEIVHLRRRIDDAAELPGVLGVASRSCLAVRLYESDRGLVAALVPADRAPATTALARAAGAERVTTSDPRRVSALTDFHPSLVAPVGLPEGVTTVADAALRDADVVYTPTGDGSTALKIHAGDLLSITGATLAALVEPGVVLDLTRVQGDGWRSGAGQPAAAFRR